MEFRILALAEPLPATPASKTRSTGEGLEALRIRIVCIPTIISSTIYRKPSRERHPTWPSGCFPTRPKRYTAMHIMMQVSTYTFIDLFPDGGRSGRELILRAISLPIRCTSIQSRALPASRPGDGFMG
ncbi:hypothetical protein NMY22_g9608 [Coprinellus aureogranulatus]|nr:hypothetical protein NMY22_g9608 [Coprinellus aureogranulatus]